MHNASDLVVKLESVSHSESSRDTPGEYQFQKGDIEFDVVHNGELLGFAYRPSHPTMGAVILSRLNGEVVVILPPKTFSAEQMKETAFRDVAIAAMQDAIGKRLANRAKRPALEKLMGWDRHA